MARIPDAEIEHLKRDIALERLVESAGIELKRHGKDLVGRCPFHDDKTPSLVVSPEKNLWHCLGACQTGGSVIDWVMKMQGISFRHAVELLRNAPEAAAATRGPVKQSTVRKLATPVSATDDERAALNQVIGYYHETLKGSNEALAYLAKRGIQSQDAIARFKLGYANRTLGLRLPEKNRKEGALLRAQLQRLGLMRASGHEHFVGSLVIPIFDDAGNVVEVYGRKIRDDLREGTAYHLYLPGPHRGVWNLDAIKGAKEVILCEALIDALTFWCAGFRNVTAAYGVEGFTADHLAAFKRYGVEQVLIAYDRDEAGDQAAARLSEKLMNEGLHCYRIQFPKGMDANDYALAVQPATRSLGVAIRKALWIGKGEPPAITTEAVSEPHEVNEPATVDLATDARFQQSITAVAQELAALDHAAPSSLAVEDQAEPAPIVLPASILPKALTEDTPTVVKDGEIGITLGERHYRVRGLNKNLALDVVLKVNVMVSRGDAFHVDTFDLYAPRAKHAFIVQAAVELNVKDDVIRHDLGRVLRKLEALQEKNVQQTLEPKKEDKPAIAEPDKNDALALLKEPKLLERILADFERCGVVGEEVNKLVGYLAATSRKLDAPLAIMVQSSSAAGKSSLMEAVLAFMPEEDQVKYSAMTGQALYYMGAINLKNKILALAEEAGAARASYALKLLQSEGVLKIASTGKNPETGELVTQEYKVEGPVMIFSTTTAIDNDEELLNRCLTLGVDESREQTRAIHELQRRKRTLEGLLARKTKARILTQHQNAQRLLRPIAVRNPYADALTFPDERTRLRRDHEKYLTLIDTIALLHQHQRPIKSALTDGETIEYVEVTLEDIETANKLAHEALGRSLDELPPQTRRLLRMIEDMVKQACERLAISRADYRFSRRDVREHAGWSDFQVKMHMHKLEEMEYVLVHRGGRGQSFVYELLYDGSGRDGKPFLMGLVDVEQLKNYHYDKKKEHQKANLEHPSSPQVDGKEPGSSSPKNNENALKQGASEKTQQNDAKNASSEDRNKNGSYPQNGRRSVKPLAATAGKKK
jgi:DNA primase